MSVRPSREWINRFGNKSFDPLGGYPPAVTARMISQDPQFKALCEELGVKPTIRQARNFRRKMGRFAKK